MTRDADSGRGPEPAASRGPASSDDSSRTGLRFATRRRVEFRDTDAAGIVHFSAFFFWMESAEHEFLRSVGLHVIDRRPDGLEFSWPRVSVSCDYIAAVRFGDEVDIEVRVAAVGRSSVTYDFAFSNAGRTVANGRVVAVWCLMRAGGRPEAAALPPDVVARLTAAG